MEDGVDNVITTSKLRCQRFVFFIQQLSINSLSKFVHPTGSFCTGNYKYLLVIFVKTAVDLNYVTTSDSRSALVSHNAARRTTP